MTPLSKALSKACLGIDVGSNSALITVFVSKTQRLRVVIEHIFKNGWRKSLCLCISTNIIHDLFQ